MSHAFIFPLQTIFLWILYNRCNIWNGGICCTAIQEFLLVLSCPLLLNLCHNLIYMLSVSVDISRSRRHLLTKWPDMKSYFYHCICKLPYFPILPTIVTEIINKTTSTGFVVNIVRTHKEAFKGYTKSGKFALCENTLAL